MARISITISINAARALALQAEKEQRNSISEMARVLLERQLVAEGHRHAAQPQASGQPRRRENDQTSQPSVQASS